MGWGAADQFIAGFLFGMTRRADHAACVRLGALAAAEVTQHYGPRPEGDLHALALAHGLI